MGRTSAWRSLGTFGWEAKVCLWGALWADPLYISIWREAQDPSPELARINLLTTAYLCATSRVHQGPEVLKSHHHSPGIRQLTFVLWARNYWPLLKPTPSPTVEFNVLVAFTYNCAYNVLGLLSGCVFKQFFTGFFFFLQKPKTLGRHKAWALELDLINLKQLYITDQPLTSSPFLCSTGMTAVPTR